MYFSLPLLRSLRQSFPKTLIHALIEADHASLLQHIPITDNVFSYVSPQKRPLRKQFFSISRKLARENFDICIHFDPGFLLSVITFRILIPFRIGPMGHWHSCLYNYRVFCDPIHPHARETENMARLLLPIGIAPEKEYLWPDMRIPDMHSKSPTDEATDLPHHPFVAMHFHRSHPSASWPVSSIIDLIYLFYKKLDMDIVLLGKPGDEPELNRIRRRALVSGHARNTDRVHVRIFDDLYMSAVFLCQAKFFVTDCSGFQYLSALAGTSFVAIYPPGRHPARFAPAGKIHYTIFAPLHHTDGMNQAPDTAGISPELVCEETRTLLELTKKPSDHYRQAIKTEKGRPYDNA